MAAAGFNTSNVVGIGVLHLLVLCDRVGRRVEYSQRLELLLSRVMLGHARLASYWLLALDLLSNLGQIITSLTEPD
ncbi:hypothetical protein J6590_096097, partial [Homalodisca vitripennis]